MKIDLILLHTFLGYGDCAWWWLWSLGAFLLGILVSCFIFGWCRYGKRIRELTAERDDYHAKFTDMEKQYLSVKYQLDESGKDNTALRASLNKCESDNIVLKVNMDQLAAGLAAGASQDARGIDEDDEDAGGLNYGSIFSDDNLQIIEGVGPKIEQLLKDAGYDSWGAVANASYVQLREVLDAAGPRYRIHDPKSWSQQAKLAHEGKWTQLVEFQKFLDTGRDDKGNFETPSKVEKLGMKILGFSNNPEDLKIVEGIGPKIEKLLKDAGINTWQELSEASINQLQEILDKAGERYRLADPGTWPKQAGLAAAGKWSELNEYQDFLQGGKDPGSK